MATPELALKRRSYELHPPLLVGRPIRTTDSVLVDLTAPQFHAHSTTVSTVNPPNPLGAHTTPDPEETSR